MIKNITKRGVRKVIKTYNQNRRPVRRKVFGIGYPKTGTTTLSKCMMALGYKHHTCDMALAAKVKNGNIDEAMQRVKSYESFEDWPWFLLYRELAEEYPEAAFILTVRKDSSRYIDSLHRHRKRQGVYDKGFKEPEWWQAVFGYPPSHWDAEAFIKKYEDHINDVTQFFKNSPNLSDNLKVLCWENGDGWLELCDFLQVSAPNLEFPHANRGA